MSDRVHIGLILLIPLAALAWLIGSGTVLKVPIFGRDYVVKIELEQGGVELDLPTVAGPEDPTRPLVVIDAGHGGHDPGAVGDGIVEKTVVLALAKALRDELLAEGGIRVALTREDDRFLVLAERPEIARRLGADLFISIHADSAGDLEEIVGASIYVLSEEASSETAARYAERENQADIVNGKDLSGGDDAVNAILYELSQRYALQGSDEFAGLIYREGQGQLRFHPEARRSAALAVLRAPDIPSVLFEAGFLTNPEEAKRLSSRAGQKAFAQVVARAMRIYFARNSASS